jgi:hypothetical protein
LPPSVPVFDPDQIGGTLGSLRDTYGISFEGNPFSNSVEDEEDITNFRIISDYMTSLLQSWIANGRFFILSPSGEAFFGTQLVLISRQLSVIVETVNEVRFALDSVFIGPSERQTLQLQFADSTLPPMFLEDVLREVETFASDEGPRLLRDGGRLAVNNNIIPVVESLQNLVEEAHDPTNINILPDGFRTARVRNALDDLNDQLEALLTLTGQIGRDVPAPEVTAPVETLSVISVNPSSVAPLSTTGPTLATVMLMGTGFKSGTKIAFIPSPGIDKIEVISSSVSSKNLLVAELRITSKSVGLHDVTVTSPDLQSSSKLTGRFTVSTLAAGKGSGS